MSRLEPLVDRVSEVAAEKARRVKRAPDLRSIKFQGGESAYLDMSQPHSAIWADVLRSLRDADQPAYIEFDPESRIITRLLLPRALTVASIKPSKEEDGVEVELVISHARHVLRRDHPDYERLLKALRSAQRNKRTVLVTEDLDTHEIVDVRPLPRERKKRRR